MWKRNEEESADRVEWVEKSVRSDLWQKGSSESERKGLQEGSETSNVLWFGSSGTDQKTGGGAEVARLKMLKFSLE